MWTVVENVKKEKTSEGDINTLLYVRNYFASYRRPNEKEKKYIKYFLYLPSASKYSNMLVGPRIQI